MRNIKNLKDPTCQLHGTRWRCCYQPPPLATKFFTISELFLFIALSTLTLQATVLVVPLAAAESSRSWQQMEHEHHQQQQMKNLSCIAHGVTFTCDCQQSNQPMQLSYLSGNVFQVEIVNCKSLTINPNALGETQGLRKINFRNINNLTLSKFALAFPRYASNMPLIIEFEKVNFELIDSHAINGNIEEISFIGGRIDTINPFGFTTIKDRAILLKMDSVHVGRIEPQAFKKFAIEQMEIKNCYFETNVPSKAFYELEVDTLSVNNNRFLEVHSRAFSFKEISKLSIAKNIFTGVDAEWMEAFIRQSITMRENNFGQTSQIAFKGIQVHRSYMHSERLELRFINNTVRMSFDPPRPLEFNDHFLLTIKHLHYDNVYSCRELDMAQKPPIPKAAFFHANIEQIYFRRANDVNTHANANSERGAGNGSGSGSGSASVIGRQRSGSANDNQSFIVLSRLIESDCQQSSYLLYIVIAIVALVLIIALIVLIVCLRIAKKRKRRKLEVVQPEPRTYKETQIIYQIENAGLLKTDL